VNNWIFGQIYDMIHLGIPFGKPEVALRYVDLKQAAYLVACTSKQLNREPGESSCQALWRLARLRDRRPDAFSTDPIHFAYRNGQLCPQFVAGNLS
jgi:hypothetical protein